MILTVLFVALAVLTLVFIAFWIVEARRPDAPDPGRPNAERVAVGFFSNFFDALGIGSFATTTTYWRMRKLVRDELIPGSLNVGHALPTVTQAYIGMSVIAVQPLMLGLMIATAVAGAWVGAGVVSRMPRRGIQVGMGVALLVAAGFMFAKVMQWKPSEAVHLRAATVLRAAPQAGAEALLELQPGVSLELLEEGREWFKVRDPQGAGAVAAPVEGYVRTADVAGLDASGWRLAVALAGSFFLGTIMPLGIGYYAPCMVLVAMIGMNPRSAFPIMMGACAFLMPFASMQFVRKNRYSLRSTAGLAVGGIFGSALALLVVKSLPLYWVMWLVTFVVIYVGISLLRAAAREKGRAAVAAP